MVIVCSICSNFDSEVLLSWCSFLVVEMISISYDRSEHLDQDKVIQIPTILRISILQSEAALGLWSEET